MPSQAPDVFLSYSPEDAEFALKLATDLKALGVNVYLPQLDLVGDPWRLALELGLLRCRMMLVILSPASLNSKRIRHEISAASRLRKKVIPILCRDLERPGLRIDIDHLQLRNVDFRTGYERGLSMLVKAVESERVRSEAERQELPEGALRRGASIRTVPDEKASQEVARESPDTTRRARLEKEQRQAAEKARLEQDARDHKEAEEKSLLDRIVEEGRLDKELRKPLDLLQPDKYCVSLLEDVLKIYSDHLPIDNVQFTLTGPSVFVPAQAHELLFWVHVEQQKSVVLTRASVLHGLRLSELSVKSEGPYPLTRGSRLSVRLNIEGLNCPDPHKWITWTGEIGLTAFVVKVPRNTPKGTYSGRASIRLNGCEIAKMSFVVGVGMAVSNIDEIPSLTKTHRCAFASYASEDRAEVLSRVQGMEAAYKGLNVFVDVVDIRSGQNWEQELKQRISTSDVFYLFWCRHAMASVWVSKEWHLALGAKGEDFIDPIPLEPPQFAPPPKELADKHFNDPMLAFIAAAGGGHS
jgi:hypothetical protein